ncbi:hypothetical protein P167DRAFT_15699 [Morchella conica CCBAS932]|uniref:Uncharacterized protein n=1 Tax=Morchella conica CCBAS932 TaxID=1392247 RepID=A0A3N4KX66_9PEZI|nr:hypothetical protein P167DRAFT_15699 [Morchella conica CCBAS932]
MYVTFSFLYLWVSEVQCNVVIGYFYFTPTSPVNLVHNRTKPGFPSRTSFYYIHTIFDQLYQFYCISHWLVLAPE